MSVPNKNERIQRAKSRGTVGTCGTLKHEQPVAASGDQASSSQAPLAAEAPKLNPADALDRYRERLAICAEAGDVPADEAERIAEREGGCGRELPAEPPITMVWTDHAKATVAEWRNALMDMATPADPRLDDLRTRLVAMLDEDWILAAAELDWSSAELFGLDPFAPIERHERWGIAVGLVLSHHNRRTQDGRHLTCRVYSISRDDAAVDTPTGARFTVLKVDRCRETAVPIWELFNAADGETNANF